MKVKIGKYKNFLGPYQLAEKLCFWAKTKDEYGLPTYPDWVHKFGEWLAYGSIKKDKDRNVFRLELDERPLTLLHRFLLWIDRHRHRTVKIQIDPWDTWDAHHTLSLIILPMLKQLKETKHGSPLVYDEDVPDGLGLRSTEAPEHEEWETDDNLHKRWDWVLNEMIWAFEQLIDENNDSQFYSGTADIYFEKCDDGDNYVMKKGPNHTQEFDDEGYQKHQERIQNGLRLFAKYYQSLWD